MTTTTEPTLTDADRALLAAEGCLTDLETAAAAVYGVAWHNALGADLVPTYDERTDDQKAGSRAMAAAALRAVGLEPGGPSLPLLLAAIRRRGWGYLMGDGADGSAWASIVDDRARAFPGRHADPATALALAFVAAVRAAGEEAGVTA